MHLAQELLMNGQCSGGSRSFAEESRALKMRKCSGWRLEVDKDQLRNDLLLHRIRENDTSKWWFFWFVVSSWGPHLLSFFTVPICFKCQMIIEWLTMSSLATSYIVVRGSASVIALIWSLSTSDGLPLCSSSSRLLSPLQNFLSRHCTVCSLAIPGPNVLLMLQAVCCFTTQFELKLKNHMNILFAYHHFYSLK